MQNTCIANTFATCSLFQLLGKQLNMSTIIPIWALWSVNCEE